MLTKTDLNQIREIVSFEVNKIVDNKLDIKLKPIKKDIKHIKKTIDLVIKNYDEADTRLEKRVTHIEEHLNISN